MGLCPPPCPQAPVTWGQGQSPCWPGTSLAEDPPHWLMDSHSAWHNCARWPTMSELARPPTEPLVSGGHSARCYPCHGGRGLLRFHRSRHWGEGSPHPGRTGAPSSHPSAPSGPSSLVPHCCSLHTAPGLGMPLPARLLSTCLLLGDACPGHCLLGTHLPQQVLGPRRPGMGPLLHLGLPLPPTCHAAVPPSVQAPRSRPPLPVSQHQPSNGHEADLSEHPGSKKPGGLPGGGQGQAMPEPQGESGGDEPHVL